MNERLASGEGGSGAPAPTEAVVRDQLERILATTRFERSPRSAAILTFIVEETLAARDFQIKARTIASNAFGADDDEDSLSDAAVRVAVGRLRRALVDHYLEYPDDAIEIAVPIGQYIPRFTRRSGSGRRVPSIAVVVFDDFGVEEPFGHVRFGLAEAIALRLADMIDLRVVGALDPLPDSTSDGTPAPTTYDFTLTGSVRAIDGVVRVAVRLLAHDDAVLWSRSYHGSPAPGALLEFEDDVVAQVAGAIGDYTGLISRHGRVANVLSDDTDVHDAVTKYLAYLHDLDEDRFRSALAALEATVDDDSAPRLQAVLAGMYCAAAYIEPHDAERHQRHASRLARAALAKLPDDPHAAFALGSLELLRGHLDEASAEFLRIPSLPSVNPTLLYGAGLGLAGVGAWDDAIRLFDRAIELNPGHPGYWTVYRALDRYRKGDHAGALDAARTVDMPSTPLGGILRAAILIRLGRPDAARRTLDDDGVRSVADLDAAMRTLRPRLFVPEELASAITEDARHAVSA